MPPVALILLFGLFRFPYIPVPFTIPYFRTLYHNQKRIFLWPKSFGDLSSLERDIAQLEISLIKVMYKFRPVHGNLIISANKEAFSNSGRRF